MEELLQSIENQIADLQFARTAIKENIDYENKIKEIEKEIYLLKQEIEEHEGEIKKYKENIKNNNELILKIETISSKICSVIITNS